MIEDGLLKLVLFAMPAPALIALLRYLHLRRTDPVRSEAAHRCHAIVEGVDGTLVAIGFVALVSIRPVMSHHPALGWVVIFLYGAAVIGWFRVLRAALFRRLVRRFGA